MASEPGECPESTLKLYDESFIRFLSSDGVVFHLRKGSIRAWSKNLLPSQHNQQVQLPEPSKTLEILFRFLETSPHPDLEAVDFRILGPLSLAADSYGVYSATQVCRIRRHLCQRQALQYDLINRPIAVMGYAIESKDWELMNKTVPLLIGESSVKMVELIKTSDMIILWFKYLEKWDEVLQTALSFSQNVTHCPPQQIRLRGYHVCEDVCGRRATTIRIVRKLGKGVKSLCHLDDTFDTLGDVCCSIASEGIKAWRAEVERSIQGIPSFSSLMNSSDSNLGDASDNTDGNT
ncbi:hypothetical protein C0992_003096 [Termitomyces sp. T32_za158]|nr:hypothetical protein C0992_003096 [Termitomyces sp. T32_za158]